MSIFEFALFRYICIESILIFSVLASVDVRASACVSGKCEGHFEMCGSHGDVGNLSDCGDRRVGAAGQPAGADWPVHGYK